MGCQGKDRGDYIIRYCILGLIIVIYICPFTTSDWIEIMSVHAIRQATYKHESGGLCSEHDIEIFRAWKKALPGYVWNKAVVTYEHGLTLIDEDQDAQLHLPNALCGYGGTGPNATVTILYEAGFGDKGTLENLVFNQNPVILSRNSTADQGL